MPSAALSSLRLHRVHLDDHAFRVSLRLHRVDLHDHALRIEEEDLVPRNLGKLGQLLFRRSVSQDEEEYYGEDYDDGDDYYWDEYDNYGESFERGMFGSGGGGGEDCCSGWCWRACCGGGEAPRETTVPL